MTARRLPQERIMIKAIYPLTYQHRLEQLRANKLEQTREKQDRLGAMDYDDQGQVLPPPEISEIVEVVSGSGVKVRQVILKGEPPL